jgi:hypothetical protein
MPRDIIEIAPETDIRSKLPPTSKVFSEQYAALLAELAVATGAVVAFAFVYYLAR